MKSKNPVNIGDVFSRLTVLEKTVISQKDLRRKSGFQNLSASICQCECGKIITSRDYHLKMGDTKSCGCLCADFLRNMTKTHGFTKHPALQSWYDMIKRCNVSTSISYKNYGAKGIKVCDKWLTFEGFWKDMGNSWSHGLSIDRINSKGNYCKENCRWANKFEQANNKSDNLLWPYEGKLLTSIEFAKILNIKPKSLYSARYRKKYGAVKRYEDG